MLRSNWRMLSRATMNAAVSCGSNPIHTLMGLIVMRLKPVFGCSGAWALNLGYAAMRLPPESFRLIKKAGII